MAAARAALAEATRRVHERDEQRSTLRDQQLARQADVARHPTARSRAGPPEPGPWPTTPAVSRPTASS